MGSKLAQVFKFFRPQISGWKPLFLSPMSGSHRSNHFCKKQHLALWGLVGSKFNFAWSNWVYWNPGTQGAQNRRFFCFFQTCEKLAFCWGPKHPNLTYLSPPDPKNPQNMIWFGNLWNPTYIAKMIQWLSWHRAPIPTPQQWYGWHRAQMSPGNRCKVQSQVPLGQYCIGIKSSQNFGLPNIPSLI